MIRLAEILSALSLSTDVGAGMPFEKGLHTCVVASALAAALKLRLEERRAVFHASLLRSIGCTAFLRQCDELLHALESPDLLQSVIAAEPPPGLPGPGPAGQ